MFRKSHGLREHDLSNLELDTVRRVRKALFDAHLPDTVQELDTATRNTADVAKALGVELGAIAKTVVYTIGNRFVMVMVAGDHECREDQLGKIFHLEGDVVRPGADLVRAVTGFSPGTVSLVGSVSKLPTAIDASLKRFGKIYVTAGHTHCVFATSVDDLKTVSNATVSYAVATPANPS